MAPYDGSNHRSVGSGTWVANDGIILVTLEATATGAVIRTIRMTTENRLSEGDGSNQQCAEPA